MSPSVLFEINNAIVEVKEQRKYTPRPVNYILLNAMLQSETHGKH
jgi:hypothetical protein